MQTPSGGKTGTTSSKRPTLKELGIDNASVFDAELTGEIGNQGFYLGGQWTRFSENATLSQALISQGQTFPAQKQVSSDDRVDWYRLGYRYRIQHADEPGAILPLEIHARAGAAFLDFHYRLIGSTGAEADRGYVKPAPQLGLELAWHATSKLSVEGEVTSTVPFSSMPWILTAQVIGKYTLVQKNGCELSGFIGGGYEKISFKDNQAVSNDINMDFGPMLMLGLELRF